MTTGLATFAAGCFWSVELVFQRTPGVISTKVGYTQGNTENPTYQEVCKGDTNHAESVYIEYDPNEVTYEQLLDVFWGKHNPTTLNQQKGDIGTQYRSGIYYHTEEQKTIAEVSRDKEQEKYDNDIVTEILPATTFYDAEEYHQRYLEKGGQCASKGCKLNIRCYG
eukprot:TRINITY_DN14444_c0_g1_i1.p1 TRINITY_DN14444_c0_g1~~TRINITY_DN14444_c0_g1_i1.p1  ORF type:complete len:166 (+),score=68.91 TRINITY_DN14444_c0_g1_i1:55-552(+)